MIWRELPVSGLTIIGVLVGISIIFRGVSGLWSALQSSGSQNGCLTFHRLRAQDDHPTIRIEPRGRSGHEIFQSPAIAEVWN